MKDTVKVRAFYGAVVGWRPEAVNMGDYEDFNKNRPDSGETAVGVCHGRGVNANLPPVWIVYIAVERVAESAARCKELGGKVVDGPRSMGKQNPCVIQDPAGAYAALIGG